MSDQEAFGHSQDDVSNVSFTAEDVNMPYEQAVRLDHRNHVTSLLGKLFDLKDALKAQCGYDGQMTVAERRAIKHNREVLQKLEKQIEDGLEMMQPMPTTNPSSRYSSFERVSHQQAFHPHQHPVYPPSQTYSDQILRPERTNISSPQSFHSENIHRRPDQIHSQRDRSIERICRERRQRQEANEQVSQDQRSSFASDRHGQLSRSVRTPVRSQDKPLSELLIEDDMRRIKAGIPPPVLDCEILEDEKEHQRRFPSEDSHEQDLRLWGEKLREENPPILKENPPSDRNSKFKERLKRDKERRAQKQKEDELSRPTSKRKEHVEQIYTEPVVEAEAIEQVEDYTSEESEDASHEITSSEPVVPEEQVSEYEVLPTVEDYLGEAPQGPRYVAEEESVSSKSTHENLHQSDDDETEKPTPEESETYSTAKASISREEQPGSLLSERFKPPSNLKCVSDGSDIEQLPDKNRVKEISAISGIGKLPQPGRGSSEENESDGEEASSCVNAEGILATGMRYMSSSLLHGTSSNLKSGSRISSASMTREEEREKRRSDLQRRREKRTSSTRTSKVESEGGTKVTKADDETRVSSKKDEEDTKVSEAGDSRISSHREEYSSRVRRGSRGGSRVGDRGRMAAMANAFSPIQTTTANPPQDQQITKPPPHPSRSHIGYRQRKDQDTPVYEEPVRHELHFPTAKVQQKHGHLAFDHQNVPNNQAPAPPAPLAQENYYEDDDEDFEREFEELNKMDERAALGPNKFLDIEGGERATTNRIPIKIVSVIQGVGLFLAQLQKPLFPKSKWHYRAMLDFLRTEMHPIKNHDYLIIPKEEADYGMFVFAYNPKEQSWIRGKVIDIFSGVTVVDVDRGEIFKPQSPLYTWSEESINSAFPDHPGGQLLLQPELTVACRLKVYVDSGAPRPMIPQAGRRYFTDAEIVAFRKYVEAMEKNNVKFEMTACEDREHGKILPVVLSCCDPDFDEKRKQWGQEVYIRHDVPLPPFQTNEDGRLVFGREELTPLDRRIKAIVGCEEYEGIRQTHTPGRFIPFD